MSITLTKIAETNTTITLGWAPVAGCLGYVFYADGARVSNSWDPLKSSIKFSKGATQYKVVAAGNEDEGVYPSVTPPPTGGVDPPQSPFTQKTGATFIRSMSEGFPLPGAVEHLHITSSPDFGIGVMQWPPAEWTGRYRVSDCIAENVVLPPFDMEGFNEAAMWFGQTGDYYRLLMKNAEWMSMFTGSRCYRSKIYDFQAINQPWVGVYPEHCTLETDFYDFNIESVRNCFNVEWWYADDYHASFATEKLGFNTNGRAGSARLKVYNGRMRSRDGYCMYLDAGTFGCQIAVDGYLDLDGPYGIKLPNVLAKNEPNIVKSENINWNSIPPERRVVYHSDPMGVYKASRLAFGLGKGRIEGLYRADGSKRRIRDWDETARRLQYANLAPEMRLEMENMSVEERKAVLAHSA